MSEPRKYDFLDYPHHKFVLNERADGRYMLAADVDARIAELEQELTAYRTDGVTEALLRKQDGYLKIGRGCVVVREDEWNAMQGGAP